MNWLNELLQSDPDPQETREWVDSIKAVIDAEGRILTPGYVDIHAHGAWEKSFDDGPDGIDVARAGHAVHGTTRQVLSLITNPVDVICRNIRTVRAIQLSAANTLAQGLGEVQEARRLLASAVTDRSSLPVRFGQDPQELTALVQSADTLESFASVSYTNLALRTLCSV